MTKIIQFKQQEENEPCDCPYCELIWENFAAIADSESPEELFANLADLVADVRHEAITEHLGKEIDFKISQYEALTSPCGNCDCEDGCELED